MLLRIEKLYRPLAWRLVERAVLAHAHVFLVGRAASTVGAWIISQW